MVLTGSFARNVRSLLSYARRRAGRLSKFAAAVVCAACLAYFVRTLAGRWSGVSDSFADLLSRPCLLAVEFLLMLTGVTVETLRWSSLRRGFMGGSLRSDFLATLRSIALGNSTPMNVGEHAGRGMSYPRRRLAALVSVMASVVQTAAIVLLGLAGGAAVRRAGMEIPRAGLLAVAAAGAVALVGLAVIWRRRRKRFSAAAYVAAAFGLSALKVCLFSLQLFLLLASGGCASPGLYCAVLFYYLCVTVTPRLSVADVGVKGAWAEVVLGPWVGCEVAMAATVALWVINILLPTLAGYAALFFATKWSGPKGEI